MKDIFCCLTCDLFKGSSYSINYHAMLMIREVLARRDYHVRIYDYEASCELDEEQVLDNLGFPELKGRLEIRVIGSPHLTSWAGELAECRAVLCQMYYFADVIEAAKRKNPGLKVISWIHSVIQEEYLASLRWGRGEIEPFIQMQEKLASVSDVCVFDSEMDMERGRLDFSCIQRAAVLYPVTEVAGRYVRGRSGCIDTSGIKDLRDLELLFVGRWDYRKGIENLIPCSFRLFAEYGIRTVMISDGWNPKLLRDEIGRRQFGILKEAGGLTLVPWKSKRSEYLDYVGRRLRLAVLPSFYDPFNMIAYDCALIGLPLVLSNRCGVCEIMEPCGSLRICNPFHTSALYQNILDLAVRMVEQETMETVRVQSRICDLAEGFLGLM